MEKLKDIGDALIGFALALIVLSLAAMAACAAYAVVKETFCN